MLSLDSTKPEDHQVYCPRICSSFSLSPSASHRELSFAKEDELLIGPDSADKTVSLQPKQIISAVEYDSNVAHPACDSPLYSLFTSDMLQNRMGSLLTVQASDLTTTDLITNADDKIRRIKPALSDMTVHSPRVFMPSDLFLIEQRDLLKDIDDLRTGTAALERLLAIFSESITDAKNHSEEVLRPCYLQVRELHTEIAEASVDISNVYAAFSDLSRRFDKRRELFNTIHEVSRYRVELRIMFTLLHFRLPLFRIKFSRHMLFQMP
ncbi:unnamed protein product [Protopolystoma xenopodis]|uniref:Uncharacterized protein n=1 Tax=Protopolystoma xenopodis TaxID=117903 RepID=A0A3S5A4J3_9PLAT|nr:unnamed protein product [Protopolystoma xenopodis]